MGFVAIVGMIIVGFIVGVLARWLYPGTVHLSFLMTTLLGIGGSLIGGIFSSLVWSRKDGRYHPAGWIMSILGAMVLIWAYFNVLR